MKTNLDLVRLLVRKAESDLAAVHRTVTSQGPYDTGLFHCQQVVEKYLKALLAGFNPFAVTIRYDDLDLDNDLSLSLLQEILAKVEQVRAIISAVLPEEVRL